jgi:hypothetical protein
MPPWHFAKSMQAELLSHRLSGPQDRPPIVGKFSHLGKIFETFALQFP